MVRTLHVIGAGIAGLACAVQARALGWRAIVHEAAGHAGGRCRSFHDPVLDRTIDNGNHLILSGNPFVTALLNRVGAGGGLTMPARAAFPMLDLGTGEHWCVRPNAGRLPWWLLVPSRRVPGVRLADYAAGIRFARAGADATVADVLAGVGETAIRRFWEPFAVAVLNADVAEGAAALLWPVLRETFGRGGRACRPRLAHGGLSAALVDPAVAWLRRRECEVRFGARVRGLDLRDDRVAALSTGEPVAETDAVVVAVPPWSAAGLVPGLEAPTETRSIVNVHFRIADPAGAAPELVGVVGGLAQWVFRRGDVASVTISAADRLLGRDPDSIAAECWPEVRRALGLDRAEPIAARVIKEKRATFAQTPAQAKRRPATRTRWRNLLLAGDWTDTGLPATIEGAARSGYRAAFAAHGVMGDT